MKGRSGRAEPEPPSEAADRTATEVVDAAFKVHSTLGPGLLESVYEACLCHELDRRRISVHRQVALPVVYEGLTLESGLRMDLVPWCLGGVEFLFGVSQ